MIMLYDLRDCVSQAYYDILDKTAPFYNLPEKLCLWIIPYITYDFDTFHRIDDAKSGFWMYEHCNESDPFFHNILEDMYNSISEWSKEKRAYIGGFDMYVEQADKEYGISEWESYRDYRKSVSISGNFKVKEF